MSRAATSSAQVTFFATTALVLLGVLGLAGCAPRPEKESSAAEVRAEVEALFENYVEALSASDSTEVISAYAPDSQATLAGRSQFFRGREAIGRTARETLLNPGQNKYDIDSLEVIPLGKDYALALVLYAVEPSDQDIPEFHSTATYVLRKSGGKSGAKWEIIHAHSMSAREL